jgi:hypothetical protein
MVPEHSSHNGRFEEGEMNLASLRDLAASEHEPVRAIGK